MRIRTIRFHSHPVLGDLQLDFTDAATGRAFDTVVIAGENGTGKTAVLQGIHLAMSGNRSNAPTIELELSDGDILRLRKYYGAELLRPKGGIVVIRETAQDPQQYTPFLEIEIESGEIVKREFDPGGVISTQPFRCLYNEAHLGYGDVEVRSFKPMDLDTGEIDPVKAGANLGPEISQLLVNLTAADNETLARWVDKNPGEPVPEGVRRQRISRFDQAIQFMFPTKRFGNLLTSGAVVSPSFTERGKEYPITALSSGEKQILFRGGFLLQYPHITSGAVILIDEPELGLHPNWQSKLVDFYKLLCSESPDETNQLIFATHSPFVVHDSANTKVVVLTKDPSTGHIEVEPEPIYPSTGHARVVEALNIGSVLKLSPKSVVALVEGETDQLIFETAWSKLRPNVSCPYEFRSAYACSQIRTILANDSAYRRNNKKLVGIFDFDEAHGDWDRLWNKEAITEEPDQARGLRKRHPTLMLWAMLLPVPPSRQDIAGTDFGLTSRLSIELLFDQAELVPGVITMKKAIGGAMVPHVAPKAKTRFSEAVASFPPSQFANFEPIFRSLDEILRYENASEVTP